MLGPSSKRGQPTRRKAMTISAQPELMRLSQQPGRPMVEIDMARLAGHLPLLAGLGRAERQALAAQARVHDLPAATAIVRYGEQSSDAFILLGGHAVAGIDIDGSYRTFEVLNVGDLFGEIGAL